MISTFSEGIVIADFGGSWPSRLSVENKAEAPNELSISFQLVKEFINGKCKLTRTEKV